MFSSLNTGAIGIRNHSLEQTLALAQRCGYGGVDFNIREAAQLADEHGIDWLRDLFARHNARPGNWGLPVNWQGDDWEADVEQLPALAQVAQELGALCTTTWCPSHFRRRATLMKTSSGISLRYTTHRRNAAALWSASGH